MAKEISTHYLENNTHLHCGVDMGSEPYFAKDKTNSLAEHLLDKSSIP